MLFQILLLFSHILLHSSSLPLPTSTNLTHLDSVARDLVLRTKLAHRRRTLSDNCHTSNPIDDCWLCSSADWHSDRFRLADCSIGFGRGAIGGKNGRLYTVTDPSDSDPSNPVPGTLRHAVIQDEPLWIVFGADMSIHLNEELLVNSFKTLDGRGAEVHIAGGACITIRHVSNVIVHNLHIHDCIPAGNARVRSSTSVDNRHGRSDGDGISVYGSHDVWVDHCTLSSCTDGLIDVTEGSTRVTISNNHFSHHDKVMLLGHSDDFAGDAGMQVTVAFNRFGEKLVQRMPRCRHGYFHVVNNDYMGWGMYAVGGSASPTINSQGNRYAAPADKDSKEVTKRINVEKEEWSGWDWRSEGDLMLNGAFFVASGEGSSQTYKMAASTDPLSAELVDQLTRNVGVLALSRSNGEQNRPGNVGGDSRGFTGGDGWVFTGGESGAGDVRAHSAAPPPSLGFEILLSCLVLLFLFLFQLTS